MRVAARPRSGQVGTLRGGDVWVNGSRIAGVLVVVAALVGWALVPGHPCDDPDVVDCGVP